jgi:hypothetical protein
MTNPARALVQRAPYRPSDPLVDTVLAPILAAAHVEGGRLQELRDEAREHLRNVVLGFLTTLARSLQQSPEKAPSYSVAAAGEFPGPMKAAFLFRIQVPEPFQLAFFSALHHDIEQAAQRGELEGPFWELTAAGVNRVLELRAEPEESEPSCPRRQRAKAVPLRLGKL